MFNLVNLFTQKNIPHNATEEQKRSRIKIFIFDLDETLFATAISENNPLDTRINNVPYEIANFHPYRQYGNGFENSVCLTLNKEKIKKILQTFYEHNKVIGFITRSLLTQNDIALFFESEFIPLRKNFPFFNRSDPRMRLFRGKTIILNALATAYAVKANEIAFIDNDLRNLQPANYAGFYTIYADNNPSDTTNGELYLAELEKIASILCKSTHHQKQKVSIETLLSSSTLPRRNTTAIMSLLGVQIYNKLILDTVKLNSQSDEKTNEKPYALNKMPAIEQVKIKYLTEEIIREKERYAYLSPPTPR